MADLNDLQKQLEAYKRLKTPRAYGDPYNDSTIPRNEFGRALDMPIEEEPIDPIKELKDAQKEEKENQEAIKLEKEMQKTQDMLLDLNKNGIPDALEEQTVEPEKLYTPTTEGRSPAAMAKPGGSIPLGTYKDTMSKPEAPKKEVQTKKSIVPKFNTLLTNMDLDPQHIYEVEGVKEIPYALPSKKFPKSGVTVGPGIDFGQRSYNEIKSYGVSDDFLKTITRFIGKRGKAAEKELKEYKKEKGKNIKLNKEDIDLLSEGVAKTHIKELKRNYDKLKPKVKYDELPDNVKSGLFSYTWQFGPGSVKSHDTFSKYIKNADWGKLADHLEKKKNYIKRRKSEADLFRQSDKTKNLYYDGGIREKGIPVNYDDNKKNSYQEGGFMPMYPADEPALSPQIPQGTDPYPGMTQRFTPDERAIYESLAQKEDFPEYLDQGYQQPIVQPPTEAEILAEQPDDALKTRESKPKEEKKKDEALDILEQYRKLKEKENRKRELASKRANAGNLAELIANIGRASETMYEGIPGVKPQYDYWKGMQKQAAALGKSIADAADATKGDKPRFQQSDWIDDKGNPLTFDKYTGKLYTSDRAGKLSEYTGIKTRKISNLYKDKEGRRYRYHADGRKEYIESEASGKYAKWDDMTPEQQKDIKAIGKEYRKELSPIRDFESTLDGLELFVEKNLDGTISAIKRQLARTVGQEKGVMTDKDVAAFGGTDKVLTAIAQYAHAKIHGGMTDAIQNNFSKVIEVASKNIALKKDKLEKDYVNPALFRLGDKADVNFVRTALGMLPPKKSKLSIDQKKSLIRKVKKKYPNASNKKIIDSLKRKYGDKW